MSRGKRMFLVGCFAVISFLATDPALWPWFVACMAVVTGFVLLVSRDERPALREVLVLAVVFRLLLLPLMPSLSDDGFRYVWDGLLQTDGINPYLYHPDDPSLRHLQERAAYEGLNSKEYYSVYPPLSQFIFYLSVLIGPDGFGWRFLIIKIFITAAEIGALFLLAGLVDPRKLVLYAWNPLVIVEVAGQGHGEGLVAALLIVIVWGVRKEKPQAAVAALTGAIWVKLMPVLLLPFVLRRTGWRHIWIPVVLSGALLAPFAAPGVIDNVVSSLKLYVTHFEFNAAPYLILKWLGYSTVGGAAVEATVGWILAGLLMVWIGRLYFRDHQQRRELTSIVALVVGGYVVLSTTVHPWYLVPVLAMLPFMASGVGAWLWFSVTSTGTYLLYSHEFYWPFVWLGWAGMAFAGAWVLLPRWSVLGKLAEGQLRYRALEKAKRIKPFLPEMTETCEVLDLGAGEGFVGEALEHTTGFRDTRSGFEIPGCKAILCDVRDANRTDLPYTVYDGKSLPFDKNSFDVSVIAFVLHHTEAPDRVIREARRVSRRRLIILETVHEGLLHKSLLAIADRLVNRIRSQGASIEQEKFLRFRTVDEWITMIERDGGVIQSVRRWGRFHKQVLIVVDSEVSGPRREFMVQSVGRKL